MQTYRIDLHVHCSQYSACGRATAAQMAAAALAAGLDGIAFTNHDCYLPADLLARLREALPALKIYNAIEVSVEREHVLCYGPVLPELENWGGNCADLLRFVQERDGSALIAHPCRFRPDVSAIHPDFPPCGVEINSRNIPTHERRLQARELARTRGWHPFNNSDAHDTGDIGLYGNTVRSLPADEMELARLLRTPADWLLPAQP